MDMQEFKNKVTTYFKGGYFKEDAKSRLWWHGEEEYVVYEKGSGWYYQPDFYPYGQGESLLEAIQDSKKQLD